MMQNQPVMIEAEIGGEVGFRFAAFANDETNPFVAAGTGTGLHLEIAAEVEGGRRAGHETQPVIDVQVELFGVELTGTGNRVTPVDSGVEVEIAGKPGNQQLAFLRRGGHTGWPRRRPASQRLATRCRPASGRSAVVVDNGAPLRCPTPSFAAGWSGEPI